VYDNIPAELRQRAQWVVADQNKLPLNPATGSPADVTNPATWGTFEQAVEHANGHHYGIGFVFTANDPYTFIDLDAPGDDAQLQRHSKIFSSFASYTELSRSGKGVHIIVRGKVPTGTTRL
jgi:primase-polymerase (primpol)-like protein